MSEELESFKRNIDLVQYAEYKGYVVDRRKSSKNNIIMRKGSKKIGISVNKKTGHQNFNNFSGGGGGTIIDFCQKETGKNLGQVRQELRAFSGMQKPETKFYFKNPQQLLKERKLQEEKLLKEKMQAESLVKSEYLRLRGISLETLNSLVFKNRIFTDTMKNVCFPHVDEDKKFSGFEKKNYNFTGFSGGGKKGLWMSKIPKKFDQIVFCESGIDCLSHFQLKNNDNAAYISVAGQISQEQEENIKAVIERNGDKKIVAAFDNDSQGQKYTEELQKLAGSRSRKIIRDIPDNKDWNEDLQALQEHEQNKRQVFREM